MLPQDGAGATSGPTGPQEVVGTVTDQPQCRQAACWARSGCCDWNGSAPQLLAFSPGKEQAAGVWETCLAPGWSSAAQRTSRDGL